MKVTIEKVEAGDLPERLAQLGISPRRVLRVVLETVDGEDEISITEMAARGGAFDHLADDPDIYTEADLKQRNEDFVR